MNKHEEIEKKILQKIKADSKFCLKTEKTVEKIKKEIIKEINRRKISAEVQLVGSTAKDTYLKGNMDIDFFILYPINVSKQKIADETISIAKKILKNTEESYAEHPYLKGFYNDFLVEIVPCYKIENVTQKISAVDRTPLHTEFVKKNLKEKQKDDVRLFKRFLIGIDCYGAEAQIQGFSGYLCELLIIKFDDFSNLLKNAKNWHVGKKIAIKNNNYPDFYTPLVFIDPVDSERNVSSALSEEKFNLFVKACNEYLKKPSTKFFFPKKIKPWPIKDIKKIIEEKKHKYVGISFKKPDIIDENLYPQIRKTIRSIIESCERNGFKIHDSAYYIERKKNNIYIIIRIESKKISKTFIHTGPPARLKQNKKEFIEKWTDNKRAAGTFFIRDGRIYLEIKRDYTEIIDFLKENLKDFSLGKDISEVVNESYKIHDQNDLLKKELDVFWTKYLDERYPWDR